MARKKQDFYEEPQKRSAIGAIFRFLTMTPVWQIIVIGAIIGVIAWQWPNITDWYLNNVFTLFGWGILILLGIVIGLAVIIIRNDYLLFKYYWYRFISAVFFMLALWGIIAYFPGKDVLAGISLGGRFGLGVLGGNNTDMVGILRLILLIAAGTFFLSPSRSWELMKTGWSRLIEQMKSPGWHRMKDEEIDIGGHAHFKPSDYASFNPPPPRKTAPPRQIEEDPDVDINRRPERGVQMPLRDPAIPPKVKPKPLPVSDLLEEEDEDEKEDKTDRTNPEEMQQAAKDVWAKYSPDAVASGSWILPPVDILDLAPEVTFSQADNSERARLIEEALASYGVEAKVVQINAGPTVTQFGVEPGWDRKTKEIKEKDKDGNVTVRVEEISRTRVKVDRIASLQNDLSLALTAPSIRIEAPVPGKGIVGIEVPNSITSMVSLRGVIESSPFRKLNAKTNLALALGEGAGGEAVAGDLAKMPHLLIAGATGSGKTVCLNTIICCLLLNNTPDEVKFIMIDPKRVELTTFKGIPHLAAPVIVEPENAIEALRWLGREMNSRYQLLAEARARNIAGYNKTREGKERMPYLVLVIDELADLMMTGGDEVETILCRLAQLARAVGIHLVVATQRPSVDVITGLIKANFPTRISFAVTSQIDSRTILDVTGAEKLLGNGDMLFLPTDASKPKRIQGCYVSDAETDRLVFFWGNQKADDVVHLLKLDELAKAAAGKKAEQQEDSLMNDARDLAREHDNISTSFLQRRLHIGYPRAARIMDQLAQEMEDWDLEELIEEDEEPEDEL